MTLDSYLTQLKKKTDYQFLFGCSQCDTEHREVKRLCSSSAKARSTQRNQRYTCREAIKLVFYHKYRHVFVNLSYRTSHAPYVEPENGVNPESTALSVSYSLLELSVEEKEDTHDEEGVIEGRWNHAPSLSRVMTNNDDEYSKTPTNAITPRSLLVE
jgi:hypothetical protein